MSIKKICSAQKVYTQKKTRKNHAGGLIKKISTFLRPIHPVLRV